MAEYPIEWLQGVGDQRAELLRSHGFETAGDVQSASAAELLGIKGIGPTGAAQLSDAEVIEPDPNTTTYLFEIDRDDWEEWKQTFDDDIPIDEQLRSLIRRESLANRGDGDGGVDDQDTAKIAAIQARRYCMRASQAIPKSNQKAKDEINQITRLMDRIV